MPGPKIVTVFGATGQQGGAVARALLSNPAFAVRAATRNPASDRALALKAAGAELVRADLDDAESVAAAMAGAHGAFVVTNPSPAEVAQGCAAADAAKRAGIKHYVYSALPPVKSAIGKDCHDFDMKAEVERYVAASGVPYSIVHLCYYYENYLTAGAPRKEEDGTYAVTLPMEGPIHMIGLDTAGKVVAKVFEKEDEYLGKVLKVTGEHMPFDKQCEIISRVTGKTVKYNQVPFEVFASFPFPAAEELAVMFEFLSKVDPPYDMELTKTLVPDVLPFDKWVEDKKETLLKIMD